MSAIYLCIVVFLLCLAVFDLFVGVSNDAVNFLSSAVGAKVATWRTIMIIAALGVFMGAALSSGMMDIARHGVLQPQFYTFAEVMTVFLAVMVTDVVILDVFNSLGMPTSTTVSLVFELLGATFILAVLKIVTDDTLTLGMLINSEKALSVIIGIFVSVALAFFFGVIVQWLSRLVFTFNFKKHLRFTVAIFGGIATAALAYFIFIKGLGKSPYLPAETKDWIKANTGELLLYIFIGATIVMEIIHLARLNVFKIVVLMGTFALAMAFASNDLVNFIGVPLAGLDSYLDYTANSLGAGTHEFMMTSLMESAKSPEGYLFVAGLIMVFAMVTSKKAKNVIKTSIDLSRQDEGDQMFGTSAAARSIVKFTNQTGAGLGKVIPQGVKNWVNSRFNKEVADIEEGQAFDLVRASINLVLAAMLIIVGTNLKLPLSTTYVTFMVVMGTSLADRAWSRESAVFRITGVLSVIGGWFITAGAAFTAAAIVCCCMYLGGFAVMILFMLLALFLLIRSNLAYKKKMAREGKKDSFYSLAMRTEDPLLVLELLQRQVCRTQSFVTRFALKQYNQIIDGLKNESSRTLRQCQKELKEERNILKRYRKQEIMALRKVPTDIAIERNTWFHLGANSNQQFMYCLTRMLEPTREHVDNNFLPVLDEYMDEYEPIRAQINELMTKSEIMILAHRYDEYTSVLDQAQRTKLQLSSIRKTHIDRMQEAKDLTTYQISLVYLNLLQESQEFLSIMRHQLRAAKKFNENVSK